MDLGGLALRAVHAARQVFQVHLVHDAEARRHDAEGIERVHAPLHELVALEVALELQLHVQVERLLRAEVVDHDAVVHHQVHRHQGLDGLGIAAQACRDVAHGGQVGQQRHAGEILQHHAGDHERDLLGALGGGVPVGELAHVRLRHLLAVAVAQHALQHDADGVRQAQDVRVGLRECRKGPQLPGLAGSGLEGLQRLGVRVHGRPSVMAVKLCESVPRPQALAGDRRRRPLRGRGCNGRAYLAGADAAGVMITVVLPSPDLPVAPVAPVLPVAPVSPV